MILYYFIGGNIMAKANSKDKVIHIHEKTLNQNGEIKYEEKQTIIAAREPDYIKLYLNTLLTFKDLPKQMSAVLFELIKRMTFADPEDEHGGQLIYLNTFSKQQIIDKLGIKMTTLDQYLTILKKSGILKSVGLGTLQANPNMFGRGEWADIKNIRAKFDFRQGTIEADIETEEDIKPPPPKKKAGEPRSPKAI